MKRDLKRIVGFCEVVVPSYAIDEFRSHFQMTKITFKVLAQELAAAGAIPTGNCFGRKPIQLQRQIFAFIWYMSNMETELSNSHVDASHLKQIKIGIWPGTGFEWQIVSTFSVQIFRLGILDYLSRHSVYFGKFAFRQTKTIFS